MSAASGPEEVRAAPSPADSDCPLSAREQTRNLLLYGANVSLVYLAAPVLYVGMTQAVLCEKLGGSKTVSNLPTTVYFWMTLLPIAVAWYFCAVRHLRPVLVGTYTGIALTGAVVTYTLLEPTPAVLTEALLAGNAWLPEDFRLPVNWAVPAVLLHSALLGGALGVVGTYQWEMIGRGVSEARRGQALGLAFGLGPVVAFLASLGSQEVLNRMDYPRNFAVLFGMTVPVMALAAVLSTRFVVPPPRVEVVRPPFFRGTFDGLGEFFGYRPILIAALAMMLVGSGYNVLNNISLYTKEAIGADADRYVGYQNALRFGCKALGGLALGYLLVRTSARMGMIVTGACCLASVLWVLTVSGKGFLLSFGLMGIGELFGVYYPNYILSCSAKAKMRRNISFTYLLNVPLGFVGVVYGLLADHYGSRSSFALSVGLLVVTLLLVQLGLPAQPRPRPADLEAPAAPPGTAVKEDVAPAAV